MKRGIYILLLGLLPTVLLGQENAPQKEKDKATTTAPSTGCIAVKPAGSHAFRNIMLAGVAGALISKAQYKVVDVANYPAKVGQKYHGNELQTIQSGGTKVIILDKKEKETNQCHVSADEKK
jgi:hypothetical protein